MMMRMFDVREEQCSTTGMNFIEIGPYTYVSVSLTIWTKENNLVIENHLNCLKLTEIASITTNRRHTNITASYFRSE